MAHLLRRAGFGGSTAQVDALMAQPSWAAVVDRVLDTTANPAESTPAAVTSTVDPYYPAWVASVHYWMNRMATSPTPIVEKVTLFWHGVLTSSSEDSLPRGLFQQIRTYRARGLGDVHDLLQAAAVDPAMLYYLNNATNVKSQPNENFARELMELFTLGNGMFAESDVVAMAKAWTGHNVSDDGERYQFRADRHDTTAKVLFGLPARNWDGPAALTEIVRGSQQATCARFLAGKLWSFFAYPNPSPALVQELASAFIAGGMNVKSLLRVIFLRPEFRLATTRTALVRSPIEWMVATMRAAGMNAETLHPEWWMDRLGQTLYQPPNVSGWRQNGAWISSSAQWGKGAYAGWVRWKANDAGLLAAAGAPATTPAAAVQLAFDRFGIDEPSPLTRTRLEQYVKREQTANRRWAIPPNLFGLTMLTPDFQLA